MMRKLGRVHSKAGTCHVMVWTMTAVFVMVWTMTVLCPYAMAGSPRGNGIRPPAPAPAIIDNDTRIDANLIDMFVTNHGSFAWDLTTGDPGLTYPKGTDKQAVFASGLWLGAMINDTIHVTVAEYSMEYSPGAMFEGGPAADPNDPRWQVYKIDVNSGPGDSDWDQWPSEDGAPVDGNGDPLLLGDQTLWCVYNDADVVQHSNAAGSTAPLGLEVQQTAFAYNRTGALGNIVFLKFLIINKGSNYLEQAYTALWSDPDLGGAGDDLVGCDTALSVGFVYNATNNDQVYGTTPPCVGYDFFQGPIVPSPGDTAYVSGVAYPGFRNLPMTSFNKYINGTDPHSATESYWYMEGLNAVEAEGGPYIDPTTGDTTTFVMPGNPTTGEGWLDSSPSDRRFLLVSGPFNLDPVSAHGDSVIIGVTAQEVVAAIVIGQGADRLNSITIMKYYDDYAQSAFDANFNLPNPPPQPSVYFQARDGYINLIWGTEADGDVEINTGFDQEFHFEGFNVYQGASIAGPWTKVATFDITNSYDWIDPVSGDTITGPVGAIYTDQFSTVSGAIIRDLVQQGSNLGVVHGMVINSDALTGGSLVNFRSYYFAVTAYSFEIRHAFPYFLGEDLLGWVSNSLENAPVPTLCIPGVQGLQDFVDADHISGLSDGAVHAYYLPEEMDNVQGHTYQVTFHYDSTEEIWKWDCEDTDADSFILQDQTNQSGDWEYPLVNSHGIMVKTIGPITGINTITEIAGPEGVPVVPPDNVMYSLNSTGEWYLNPPTTWARLNYQGLIGNDNWEIRFEDPETGGGSQYYNWIGDETLYPDRCPFEMWNTGPTDDPADDRRIQIGIYDVDESGGWSWDDYIYGVEVDYGTEPLPPSMVYTFPDDFHIGRIIFSDNTGGEISAPAPGTVVLFVTNKPNLAEDVFQFQTRPPWEGLTWDLDNVKVVPNPYYGHSQYELSSYQKRVKFINLPRECTIRIFTLGGDHVRTLNKDDTTTEIFWDLETKYGIPVASGMYIWYLDAPGIGTKEGKTAVFMERETLNTF